MRVFLPILALTGSLLLGSCASIVSHSRWPVTISSAPAGASVAIADRNGVQVYSGTTPATIELKSGNGFFRRAIYNVTFTKPGFTSQTVPLTADVNGWYFGNIIFGGIIGLLIVDPATGAMYKLNQNTVQALLSPTVGYTPRPAGTHSLQIMALAEVPDNLRPLLVPVKQ